MRDDTLTHADILRFYLPLVLTSQMMTLSVPLINLGLGRSAAPALALAAYAVGFSVAVIFNAPVLSARQITAGLVRDPASYRQVRRFVLTLAAGLTVIEVAVAVTPVGSWLLEGALGVPPEVARGARWTLLAEAPIPLFLALRGLAQGLALAYRQTILITVSTLARLATVTAAVFLLVVWLDLPGAPAGGLALSTGIGLESLLIWHMARRRGLAGFTTAPPTPAAAIAVNPGGILRFAAPLMLNHVAWSAQRALINAILSRLANPLFALAAFGVVHPLFFFASSPLFSVTSMVQVLGRTRDDLVRLVRFTLGVAAALAAAATLLAFVAGRSVLAGWYGLEAPLVAAALPALLWIGVEPALIGLRGLGQGLLLRSARTGAIAVSAAGRMLLVVVCGVWAVHRFPAASGALIGSALIFLGDAWDAAVAWARAGGLRQQARRAAGSCTPGPPRDGSASPATSAGTGRSRP